MTNIDLKSEYILNIFGFTVTNTFLTTILVTLILICFSLLFYYTRKKDSFISTLLMSLVYELLRVTNSVTNDRKLSGKVLPLIATFFIFILTANLIALIPGFLGSFYIEGPDGNIPILRSPNSDLTITLALAIFSVIAIQFFSLELLGIRKYLKRFFNFGSPVKFITGFFEMISEGVKVLSFSMRLFGNIFAGEILLLIIAFLAPYFIPVPFMILELFVGFIQAFIFAMLTLTFIKSSVETERINHEMDKIRFSNNK